jgi:hypothetical protein
MKNRLGERYITNEGCEIEIIEYFGCNNCTVRFKDGNIKKEIQYDNIKSGRLRNPYRKSVYGVGFIGEGKYKSKINNKTTTYYKAWNNMFERCYNNSLNRNPTYKDVTVCNEWHNFQNFAKWYEENWKPWMEGWHLDKDILLKGNKIYSPETCCFVPNEINRLFTRVDNYKKGVYKSGINFVALISLKEGDKYMGTFKTVEEAIEVYKKAKEVYIKEIANEWKDKIDTKVYDAMCNYYTQRN